MPIFERPPLDTLTPARERWTPIYLQHGRLEVDDSSVKWIGADRTVFRLPVATLSAVLMGPGTSVTHAAVKACAECNTPIAWVGEDGLRFYASGIATTANNTIARRQAKLHASPKGRAAVARRMFAFRFPEEDVNNMTIEQLRGMEGYRVREMYAKMGADFGVVWKGRRYDANTWSLADPINRAISAANASLYALTAAIVCSMGYIPRLGFIHADGTIPFVFDIADIYKAETSLEAAFHAVSVDPHADEKKVLTLLKQKIETARLVRRMPRDIEELLFGDRNRCS